MSMILMINVNFSLMCTECCILRPLKHGFRCCATTDLNNFLQSNAIYHAIYFLRILSPSILVSYIIQSVIDDFLLQGWSLTAEYQTLRYRSQMDDPLLQNAPSVMTTALECVITSMLDQKQQSSKHCYDHWHANH